MLSEKVKETNTQDEQYIADHTQLKAALGGERREGATCLTEPWCLLMAPCL